MDIRVKAIEKNCSIIIIMIISEMKLDVYATMQQKYIKKSLSIF